MAQQKGFKRAIKVANRKRKQVAGKRLANLRRAAGKHEHEQAAAAKP